MDLKRNIDEIEENLYQLEKRKPSFITLLKFTLGWFYDFRKYGASKVDYFAFRFWEKNKEEKAMYFTWRMNSHLIHMADNKETIDKFLSKEYMYIHLKKYVKRKQLYVDRSSKDDFIQFVRDVPVFIYKPNEGMCGQGIEKINVSGMDIESLYEKLLQSGGVLDEPVIQNKEINKLNPSSVNTVRIFTLRTKRKINFIGATLRIGMGYIVDNFCAGGIALSIDLETGMTNYPAENSVGVKFYEHPVTHENLIGFKVPNWDKVIEIVYHMALDCELNYVAWDLAIRENDVVLIEANTHGGAFTIQIGEAKGKKNIYEKLLKELKNEPYEKSQSKEQLQKILY